jgi:FixJ family two-component response regulator
MSAVIAVERTRRRNPVALLVDYRLPNMVATEDVQALDRTGVAAPVRLLTADRAETR